MEITSNIKPWGVELQITTSGATLKTDLDSNESSELICQMLIVQRDLTNYAEISDLDFIKNVIDNFGPDHEDREKIIEYLRSF